MNPLAKAFFEAAPFLAAAVLFSLLPTGRSWAERLSVGAVAGLVLVFISSMWPGAAPAVVEGAQAAATTEWPHLLNVIIFLPLLGGVGLLFLPRQAPAFLRKYTLFILGLDFVVSLFLLGVSTKTGWHVQYIHEWIPSLGIRY